MAELTWEGKYDKDGKHVALTRIPLPFQTVETVNESGQVRAHNLELWAQGQPTEWRNRLIWGDKKYVLPSLLPEFAGKVSLIYIDPPFATGADFSFTTTIPESDESFTKEPSMIEQKAYRDTWGRGLDSYLQWFYEAVVLLRDFLTTDGSIYVHCDWRVSGAVRYVLDEVFGDEFFRNELIWRRGNINTNTASNQFPRNHDTIFFYRSPITRYNRQLKPYSDATMKMYRYDDQDGRGPYRLQTLRTYSSDSIAAMEADNRIVVTAAGPNFKQYLSDKEGVVIDDVWDDISSLQGSSAERLDYATQKPEALLERIIRASSNEGDLVLDCFCGSGTAAAVAEKLGRRWIAADLGRFAISTTRKRLLSIPDVKPFVVQNLGKYERQAWQVAEFALGDERQAATVQLAYRRFMLDLYRAQPINGYTWLHGVRDGRLVHVGSVDAPVAVGDVQQIVKEFWKVRGQAGSTGVDILGWDFAFELHEVAEEMAAEASVNLKFKRVPREVLEKKAVEQGDIRFFELAALRGCLRSA